MISPTSADVTVYVGGVITLTTNGNALTVKADVYVGTFTVNENAGLKFGADVKLVVTDDNGTGNFLDDKVIGSPYIEGLGYTDAGIGRPSMPWTNGFLSGNIERRYKIPNESFIDPYPDLLTVTCTISITVNATDFAYTYGYVATGTHTENVSINEPGGEDRKY